MMADALGAGFRVDRNYGPLCGQGDERDDTVGRERLQNRAGSQKLEIQCAGAKEILISSGPLAGLPLVGGAEFSTLIR